MPQSLVRNYIHIVFSTKYRQPFISKAIQPHLYSYLTTLCYDKECPPIRIGGYLDHVHILCLLSRKIALCKLMEEIKAHSSKWMKMEMPGMEQFYWQNGYGAFSVNPSQTEKVIAYINNQEQHHRKIGYQDELRMFFKKYNVPFDERYVWD